MQLRMNFQATVMLDDGTLVMDILYGNLKTNTLRSAVGGDNPRHIQGHSIELHNFCYFNF